MSLSTFSFVLGQIASLLDSFHNGQVAPGLHNTDTLSRLETLHADASSTIKLSIKFVRESQPAYYEKMSPLIERPIEFWNHRKNVDPELRWEKRIMKRGGIRLMGLD